MVCKVDVDERPSIYIVVKRGGRLLTSIFGGAFSERFVKRARV
jgi:hypothetical protein